VISFSYKGIHPHDLSQVLDQHGVCIRAGHHCAKPLMRKLGINATARASLYVYNDEADVDALVDSLSSADELFPLGSEIAMAGLEDLYREIILDHYRNPRNRGELPTPPAVRVEGFNPLCGDEVVLYLDVEDGKVADVKISGQGCSISQSLGVDDVGGGEGAHGRRGEGPRAGLQRHDVDPRAAPRRRG